MSVYEHLRYCVLLQCNAVCILRPRGKPIYMAVSPFSHSLHSSLCKEMIFPLEPRSGKVAEREWGVCYRAKYQGEIEIERGRREGERTENARLEVRSSLGAGATGEGLKKTINSKSMQWVGVAWRYSNWPNCRRQGDRGDTE